MYLKRLFAGLAGSLTVLLGIPLSATAASNIVAMSGNSQGWSTSDTRPGGAVNFVVDSSAPAGKGALQLTTDATTAAKAQYMHAEDRPLAGVTKLSYSTKQISAAFAGGDASYQLPLFLTGTTGFTTLVFEPYENGTVTPGVWQSWNVAAGQFWSTKTVTCSGGTVTAGFGGAPFYTLADIQSMCPSATVVGYGVNIGSNNPSYNVETDLFNFNGSTYDFEPTVGPPATNSDCRNGGWKTFNSPTFKSQGKCLDYVEDHQHKVSGDIKYSANGLARQAEFNMNTASNGGTFKYSDANKGSYRVKISSVKVSGSSAWFAGQVTKASDPSWVGQWLFAKVSDGKPDQIWGSFTDKTTANNGVAAMSSPADGPFTITKGNLKVK